MGLEIVKRDVLSREFVVVALKCDLDPLADAVKIGLFTSAASNWLPSSQWVPGQTWVDGETPVYARALVGPPTDELAGDGGDMVLVRGAAYTVKAKITDNPEAPVIPCYTLKGA